MKFNFINVITTKNKSWKVDIDKIDFDYLLAKSHTNFIIISTYATFSKNDFHKRIIKLNNDHLHLIADECHNVGSKTIVKKLPKILGLNWFICNTRTKI